MDRGKRPIPDDLQDIASSENIMELAQEVGVFSADEGSSATGAPKTPERARGTALSSVSDVAPTSYRNSTFSSSTNDSDDRSVSGSRLAAREAKNKGLRQFSLHVCRKVEEKKRTTYNEVADELVRDFVTRGDGMAEPGFDEKNIRRRVYDALNVLRAMDVIRKEKKEIMWQGLPLSAEQELIRQEDEQEECRKRLQKKRKLLEDLVTQQIALKRLIEQNRAAGGPSTSTGGTSSSRSIASTFDDSADEELLSLPFILVNTHQETVIECEMNDERTNVFLNFSNSFEINDDTEILKRLGLQQCTMRELPALLPDNSLLEYVPQHLISAESEAAPERTHEQDVDAIVGTPVAVLPGADGSTSQGGSPAPSSPVVVRTPERSPAARLAVEDSPSGLASPLPDLPGFDGPAPMQDVGTRTPLRGARARGGGLPDDDSPRQRRRIRSPRQVRV